eukprot:COSAG02_NODE_1851_length_10668_cov_3.538745_2_plen_76_part_00
MPHFGSLLFRMAGTSAFGGLQPDPSSIFSLMMYRSISICSVMNPPSLFLTPLPVYVSWLCKDISPCLHTSATPSS